MAEACKICGAHTNDRGRVYGRYSKRDYGLARCEECGYAFVTDPWLDYARIYDDAYYSGQGADPLVDYQFELEYPHRTIRYYEWQGIARLVKTLVGDLDGRRWLDYGCGNGGLVRHLRAHQGVEAVGFEQGSIAKRAEEIGIPILDGDGVEAQLGSYDVVTAIEVLEHTPDPVAELRRMRRLLRPGGLLFLTTGNARPHADRLREWPYVIPEIHISFFEPRTLHRAFTLAGFRPEHRPLGHGFDEILTFKALKNLRVRRRSVLTDLLPRRPIGFLADLVAHTGEHPIAWAA
jgi:SAM-dependent methyltransferase